MQADAPADQVWSGDRGLRGGPKRAPRPIYGPPPRLRGPRGGEQGGRAPYLGVPGPDLSGQAVRSNPDDQGPTSASERGVVGRPVPRARLCICVCRRFARRAEGPEAKRKEEGRAREAFGHRQHTTRSLLRPSPSGATGERGVPDARAIIGILRVSPNTQG